MLCMFNSNFKQEISNFFFRFEECVEGGESILLDVNRVAEEFRIQHPEDFKILTQNAVTIQKVHYER